jgi:hypothetical protein
VRKWLRAIDDQLLLEFGLTPADIAALRNVRGGNFSRNRISSSAKSLGNRTSTH